MRGERKIREEIFDRVKKLYRQRVSREGFIPGKTRVNYAGRVYDDRDMAALVDASLDFWLTSGRYAERFEKEFAEFLGVKYCLLVNSGSSANLLAVAALTSPLLKERRLKAGDEVITTPCGFPTTLNPIIQNNLAPVFIDVEIGTYNIDSALLERAVSKKTKAIFVPHTLGNPADIETILRVAKKYNLWFIEDNCDSLGSRYDGKPTGAFGHISTSSFYPPHHITMGEGGAVLTDDPLLRRIILSFRDWGRGCWCGPGHDNTCRKRFIQKHGKLPFGYDHKYVYSHVGYNLKITDMQAAVGCTQLDKLRGFLKKRQENFRFFQKVLKKYEKYFILPEPTKNSQPAWFGFPILVKENAPFSRNEIVNYLEQKNIATRMLFGGNLTKQPAYQDIKYRICGSLKNSDLVMGNLFWIGVYPGISQKERAYVTMAIESFMDKIKR